MKFRATIIFITNAINTVGPLVIKNQSSIIITSIACIKVIISCITLVNGLHIGRVSLIIDCWYIMAHINIMAHNFIMDNTNHSLLINLSMVHIINYQHIINRFIINCSIAHSISFH